MTQEAQEQTPDELSRVRAVLDQQDWKDLLPRLVRIGLYLLRKNNVGVALESTSAGKTVEDFVMDAIMKLYTGERRWDMQKYPNLLYYLLGILRSLISHEFERRENRTLVFVEDLPEHGPGAGNNVWLELEIVDGFMLEEFKEFVKDDPGLETFVSYLAEGHKPREIAQEMGFFASANL